MKSIIFSLILFSITGCNTSASELDKVKGFSNKTLEILRDQDEVRLKKLPVYPDSIISDDVTPYFFDDAQGVAVFLKRSSILSKYYGPYTRNDAKGNNSYSIVYYDAQQIKPNEEGFFSPTDIKKAWGTSYLETVVTVVKGMVMFHRTPFYYGSHAPWEDDY